MGVHKLCGCDTLSYPLTNYDLTVTKECLKLKELRVFNVTAVMFVLLFGILIRGAWTTVWEKSQAPFIIQGSVRDICFPDYFSSEVEERERERRGDGEGEGKKSRERETQRETATFLSVSKCGCFKIARRATGGKCCYVYVCGFERNEQYINNRDNSWATIADFCLKSICT